MNNNYYPDDNKYHYTDDYIGHIFDTTLNNISKNDNIKKIDVQKNYNRFDTFENKNNKKYKNNYIKFYILIIIFIIILFLYYI